MAEPLVLRLLREYRQRVLLQDAAQMREMARRWLQVENALQAQIDALAADLADASKVTPERIARMNRFQSLIAQAQSETNRYNAWSADLIAGRQRSYAQLGIEAGSNAIRAVAYEAGRLNIGFDLLPTSAIETMIGFAGDGTPLQQLLSVSYSDLATQVLDGLVRSTALGTGPRQTARVIANSMAGNLDRALTVARTEQLRAFREASRQQYQASGVVTGYRRIAAKQQRTCIACIAADGRFYRLDQPLDEHPNGRCSLLPIVEGIEVDAGQSAQDWFGTQAADVQQKMLGQRAYEAFSKGEVGLADMIHEHHNATWGKTLQVASWDRVQARQKAA